MTYVDGKAWLLVGNKQPEFWWYIPSGKSNIKNQISNILHTENSQLTTHKLINPSTHQLTINPNPFSNLTTIRYNVTSSGKVSIKLYNSTGKLITTLVNETRPAGSYSFDLNQEIPQGIYFIKYESGNQTSETKLIVE
jgi:hypothetical protein